MCLRFLVRDQKVEGSNPFAPTTYFLFIAFRLARFPGALFLSFLGRCFRLLLDSGTNLNRMHVLLLYFDIGRTAWPFLPNGEKSEHD
jgi:hypothetical protein